MRVLVVNDDGVDSPLLRFLVEELTSFVSVVVVAPAEEQSWKGKAITRYGKIQAVKSDLFDVPAWSATGLPADCTNLGIYNLCQGKVDLVISGINLGHNQGGSFLFSSGTVGAALEANIAGLPALALSQGITPHERHFFLEHGHFPDNTWGDLEQVVKKVVPPLLTKVLAHQERLLSKEITWNINIPREPQDPLVFTVARAGRARYGQCFFADTEKDIFVHSLQDVSPEKGDDTDHAVLQRGEVAITPLRLFEFGALSGLEGTSRLWREEP